VNSHCLFCGKRLSFFHDKKKPYCSDVHEDRYREQESRTGLSRLQDDYPAPTRQEIEPVPGLPPPRVAELFTYEAVDPAILEEIHRENGRGAEEMAGHGDPPAAEYLIADSKVIHPAPQELFVRDLGNAAFPEEDWGSATVLEASSAAISLDAAQIGIDPVTFPRAEPVVTKTVVANVVAHIAVAERVETRPEPPAQVTSLADIQTRPLANSETIPARVFCEPSSAIALPGLVGRARHSALAPIAARTRIVESSQELAQARHTLCAQPGLPDSLPAPEPLRFRALLDLHNHIFQTTKRRLAPASPVPLDWTALPPESIQWRSKPVRRQVAPLIPKLSKAPAVAPARLNAVEKRESTEEWGIICQN
jgi:hypothetical protein